MTAKRFDVYTVSDCKPVEKGFTTLAAAKDFAKTKADLTGEALSILDKQRGFLEQYQPATRTWHRC